MRRFQLQLRARMEIADEYQVVCGVTLIVDVFTFAALLVL